MESKQITKPFLLDTCAWLWISLGTPRLTSLIQKRLSTKTPWLLSAISVWEVAMLTKKGRIKFDRPIEHWINDNLIAAPHLNLISIEPDIAVLSCNLKNYKSTDPADCMIVATAICHNATLVTGDKKMIEYSRTGHLSVLKI